VVLCGLVALAGEPRSNDLARTARRLTDRDWTALAKALASTDTNLSLRAAQTLGEAEGQEALPLLRPVLQDERRGPAVRRQAARSLAKSLEGTQALLQMARDFRLASDVRFTVASVLNQSRWPEVRAAADEFLPWPRDRDGELLPSLEKLAGLRGHATNGAALFTNATLACSSCHVVNGQGTEMGPDLSDAGARLSRTELIESVLDPCGVITPGYESWMLYLRSDEQPYGLWGGETRDEVVIKMIGGVEMRYPKSEVLRRERMPLSLMPAGLHQGMTTQEFADLLEYLAALRGPTPKPASLKKE
jgi:putative heme-binding domain-containing protein